MRLELFFKEAAELEKIGSFMRAKGITHCNLPNKGRKDDVIAWVRLLRSADPSLGKVLPLIAFDRAVLHH
jgi:hypothetical protein